jgi:hypothetical protein
LGEDGEARVGVLFGEVPGLEIPTQLPIGHRGLERAPDPSLKVRRDPRVSLAQDLTGPIHHPLKRLPVVVRRPPDFTLPQLGAAESVDRVDQGREILRVAIGNSVDRPDDRAGTSEPADLPRFS